MHRRILAEKVKGLFLLLKKDPSIHNMMRLPGVIRMLLGIICVILGIIGMITPLPIGIIFLAIGMSFIVGMTKTRAIFVRFIHFSRLNILYAKFHIWYQNRRNKRSSM